MNDITRSNIGGYGSWLGHTQLFPGEQRTIEQFLRPGMLVLDLGCGRGRVAVKLLERGLRVVAGDLALPALEECRRLTEPMGATVMELDARDLPFDEGSFDAVLFPFAGLDFIHPEESREKTVRGIARVLKPGGVFAFSTHNALGSIFSPRGLRVASLLRWRWRMLKDSAAGSGYFRDPNGLHLYFAPPQKVIRDVEGTLLFRVAAAFTTSGFRLPRPLLHLFSSAPHYVFTRTPQRC